MSAPFLYSARTDTGRVREINEDAVFMEVPSPPKELEKRGCLFGVADGLGGMARGEEASRLAAEEMHYHFLRLGPLPAAFWLHSSMQAVNTKICTLNSYVTQDEWMATTLTCSHFRGSRLTVGHVGDTRLYRLRGGELVCLTTDHASGRHTLTRAVGTDPRLVIDIYEFEIREGDVYVQCSDGLYAAVSEGELRQTAQGFAPEEACGRLVDLANQNGGDDNISVQIIRVTGERA